MKKMALALCALLHTNTINTQHAIHQPHQNKPSLLIIDTDGHDQYHYRNLMLLAQSVGFQVTYRKFYSFLENNQILNYDAVFFITSIGLFKNIQSPLIAKCIASLRDYARMGNKTIGILLPGLPSFNQAIYAMSLALMEELGVFAYTIATAGHNAQLRQYVAAELKNIFKPDMYTGHLYGTTLVNAQQSQQANAVRTSQIPLIINNELIATPLPRKQDFSARARSTLPAGLYVKNKATGNRYFMSKISEFTFADMPENFFKNPIHLEDRNELLSIAQHMLFELHQAVTQKNMPLSIDQSPLELPALLTLPHMEKEKQNHEKNLNQQLQLNKHYSWIVQDGISCAWEAPDDYFLYDDTTLGSMDKQQAETLKVKALDQGISFLYDAAVNLVWFEFNAEAYLSDHARFKKDKQRFINQVNAIAQQLKQTAQHLKKPMPKVFIGTDITTNFATHPVTNQAQDIFGHTYSKIPSPLDLEFFWKPEVIEPFDLFCKTFKQHMPITGIFLDFEMYHAPEQASAYNDHMDFSHNTWQQCCHLLGDGSSCGLNTVGQRVDYLMNNRLFNDYFAHLEQEAARVGLMLKKHLQNLMPNLLIAAYLPTLPTSWFYRGILRGLGTKQEPVITATFNTDFYSHAQWLQDNNIHLIHGTPLLLSKIQSNENFNLIPRFLKYHDFVWYNRPSRMVYRTKTGKWWSTEASPLQSSAVSQGIRKAKIKKQKMTIALQ